MIGGQPAKQEKMAAAEGAAVGEKNPVDGLFNGVSHADASEVDGTAIGAACGEHGYQAPVLAALPVEVARAFRKPCPETATLG